MNARGWSLVASARPAVATAAVRFAASLGLIGLLAGCQPLAPRGAGATESVARRAASTEPVARLAATAATVDIPPAPAVFRAADGIVIALLPAPDTNLVRVDIRYRSGASRDLDGKDGLAHVVEHLTFRMRGAPGEPTLGDRLGRDALVFNGFTRWDDTRYHATAFAPQLDALLAIEADRMSWGCDELPRSALGHERSVVERELEARGASGDDSPAAALRRAVFAPGHAYHRPVSGSPATLRAITRDDACQFLAAHYRPDNAILVVSGRFDVAAVKAVLARRHGALRALAPREVEPADAATALAATEPAATTPAPTTIRANVGNPALVALVPSPPWGSRRSARSLLALFVLTDRLEARAQHDDAVVAFGPIHVGGRARGMHGVFIAVRGEADLDRARQLLRDIAADPLFGMGDQAVAAIRSTFSAGLLQSGEGFEGRAILVADALQYAGARGIGKMLAAAQAASRDDIDGELRAMLHGAVTVRVLARGDARRGAPNTGANALTGTLAAGSLHGAATGETAGSHDATGHRGVDAAAGESGDADGETPWLPEVDDAEADRQLVLPAAPRHPPAQTYQLANGLRVVLLPRPGYPVVYTQMVFAGGHDRDPAGRAGFSEFAAQLRRPGLSAPWTAPLADDLARVAALPVAIDATVEDTTTRFHGAAPSAHAAALLWNLCLHVRYGGYVQISDIGKILWRRQFEALAEQRRASVEGVIAAASGDDAEGDLAAFEATISALAPDQLTAYADRHYRPEGAILVVAGAFDPKLTLAGIRALFETWQPETAAGDAEGTAHGDTARAGAAVDASVAIPPGSHVVVADDARDHPRVIAVYRGVGANGDVDRAAAEVLAEIVERRLVRELRVAMAATYHVAVRFRGDALVIDVELGGPTASRAVLAMQDVLARLLDDRFRADFTIARRKTAERAFARSMSAAMLAERAASALTRGDTVALDDLGRNIARLRPDVVAKLIERRLAPGRASVIIAADRDSGLRLFAALGIAHPRVVD